MSKKIKLKALQFDNDYFVVQVVEQTHIGNYFGYDDDNFFTSKTGFTLYSVDEPSYDFGDNEFYVRGIDGERDDCPIIVQAKVMDKLIEAVMEYNKTFADKEDKEDKESKTFYIE